MSLIIFEQGFPVVAWVGPRATPSNTRPERLEDLILGLKIQGCLSLAVLGATPEALGGGYVVLGKQTQDLVLARYPPLNLEY